LLGELVASFIDRRIRNMSSTKGQKKRIALTEQAIPNAKVNTEWTDRTREPPRYESGSIEQHLDMCEKGPYRGDEILHHHGLDSSTDGPYLNYRVDMSEENREGMELSGEDHSVGLPDDEAVLAGQEKILEGSAKRHKPAA